MSTSASMTESLILRRLAIVHQNKVAEAIGADETMISRFSSGERGLRIGQIEPALKAMGLKVVSIDEVTISSGELSALRTLARKALGPDE